MRKILFCLAATSLAGPAAAQTLSPLDSANSVGTEAAVFLRPVRGQSAEALDMARLIVDSLENSRELNRVDVPGEAVMQLEAPVAMVRKANGANLSVSFEIRPIRGNDETFSVTCPADFPDRCVDAIILRTERMARMDQARR